MRLFIVVLGYNIHKHSRGQLSGLLLDSSAVFFSLCDFVCFCYTKGVKYKNKNKSI